ncbi:unnamed protein product [Brachionus calyciflorus]|uniref:FYVE-type domain-containing protein n=1 Tax=Brachionus calyciflorus TaxID=104777 RepID=A0A813MHY6_9BILA|nr:unnamed protein product [Brachionus calyciflorus]
MANFSRINSANGELNSNSRFFLIRFLNYNPIFKPYFRSNCTWRSVCLKSYLNKLHENIDSLLAYFILNVKVFLNVKSKFLLNFLYGKKMPVTKKIFESLNEHPLFKKNSNLNKSTNKLIETKPKQDEPIITVTDYSVKNIKSSSLSNIMDKPFTLYSSTEFLYPSSQPLRKSQSVSHNNLLTLANNGYLEPVVKEEYSQPFPLPELSFLNLTLSRNSSDRSMSSMSQDIKYLNDSIDLDAMAAQRKCELISKLINDLQEYLVVVKILDEDYSEEVQSFNLKATIDTKSLENIFIIVVDLHSLISQRFVPQLKIRLENQNKKNSNKMICDIFAIDIENLQLYERYIEQLETFLKNLHRSSRFTQFKQFTIDLDKRVEAKYKLELSKIRHPFKKTFLSYLAYVINFPNIINQFLIAYENFISVENVEFKYFNEIIEYFNDLATKSIERIENTKNFETIASIQKRIGSKFCIINKKRSFVKEGVLYALSPFLRKVIKIYVILLNDLLIICDFRNNDFENLKPKKPIDVTGMSVSNDVNEYITGKPEKLSTNPFGLVNEDNGFAIHAPSILKVFRLFTRNMQEKKSWIDAFGSVCNANKFYTELDRTNLGKQKPKLMPFNLFPYCFKCKSEFTTFVRRNHCKACGYVFCPACSRVQVKLEYENGKASRVCDICCDFLYKTFRTGPPSFEQIQQSLRKIEF